MDYFLFLLELNKYIYIFKKKKIDIMIPILDFGKFIKIYYYVKNRKRKRKLLKLKETAGIPEFGSCTFGSFCI